MLYVLINCFSPPMLFTLVRIQKLKITIDGVGLFASAITYFTTRGQQIPKAVTGITSTALKMDCSTNGAFIFFNVSTLNMWKRLSGLYMF